MMKIFTSILGKYSFIASAILLLLSSMVIATYYLTEEIRGDAGRINLAGRQRMHVFHLANHAHFLLCHDGTHLVNDSLHISELNKGIDEYEKILYGLKFGCQDCEINLAHRLTAHDGLAGQLDWLITLWEEEQKPRLRQIAENPIKARSQGETLCLGCHDFFVDHFGKVDEFVFALADRNEQVMRTFNLLRFGILIVSGLAAVCIAFFVKQQMIRPVRELYDAAARLEQGDFSCRVTPRTNDEIGTLAHSFNRMSLALAQSFHEKETLVQQRTAELQIANEELKIFTYTVSHDLRAPLRAVQGFAAALREDGQGLDPRIIGHVNNISSAADYMDTLIIDLLSYSQISFKDIHIVRVDVGEIIKEVVKTMSLEIQQVDGQVTIEDCLPEVMANHGILTQIMINLLRNAIKFTKHGVQPKIRIWSEKQQDTIRIFVSDNGIGIAPANHKRIFDVFVRLHGMDRYPGTGIGLATVRRGIERLGGSCGVDSVLGQGSTFWLEFPVVVQGRQECADDSRFIKNREV